MFVCRRVWWSLPRYYKKKTTTKYNPLTILNNHFVCLFFFFVFLLSRDINHLNISRFLGAFNHVTLFTNAMGIDFVPWKPTTRDNRAYDRRSFIIRCEIISTSVFNWEKEKKKKKGRAKGKVSTSLSFFGCWPLESFLCVCVSCNWRLWSCAIDGWHKKPAGRTVVTLTNLYSHTWLLLT